MKKPYMKPTMVVHKLCTETYILTLSGNLKEGETGHIGVSNEELEGDALVKGDSWGDIWE
ncbi:MAG: hypothetical protein IJS59_06030 [Bacteroidaceae bacterium]|nr:hypothetical protein [Bacteroidaceae bacterium]